MSFIRKVKSKNDSTIKYIFKTKDNLIVEYSYIDKNDGKDIICIPSQTMCLCSCKFCHSTEYIGKIPSRNLSSDEIIFPIKYIINDLNLVSNKKTLLISIMGIGEPIFNYKNIIQAMMLIKKLENSDSIPYIRFAIATSIPKNNIINFFKLTEAIKKHNLPVKLHFSLHYTNDEIRNKWMPASLDIHSSLNAIDFYKNYTGNPVEIHYALIDGVNDTEIDAIILTDLLKGKYIDVKFLFYNKKEHDLYHTSKNIDRFKYRFKEWEIDNEYYVPPGLDVGASCGAFMFDNYVG
jgi:23S rRNA (adenine2503-C2)-methyltransferase